MTELYLIGGSALAVIGAFIWGKINSYKAMALKERVDALQTNAKAADLYIDQGRRASDSVRQVQQERKAVYREEQANIDRRDHFDKDSL